MIEPIIHALDASFDIVTAFQRLAGKPGCLWLDSAARGPELQPGGDHAGRYSFLCADPIQRIVATCDDENPWPQLNRWWETLPKIAPNPAVPFQGGIAGLWGYEAGVFLENVGRAKADDFPVPVIDVGVYDWVICHDRLRSQSWITSTGLTSGLNGFGCDGVTARRRLDQVLDWIKKGESVIGKSQPCLPVELANGHPTHWKNVWSDFSSDGYRDAIREIITSIRDGDCFQVNLSQRLMTPATCDSATLMMRLRQFNPAPYAGYFHGHDYDVICSSPEGFLSVKNRVVQTRPIKGTAPRTGDPVRDEQYAIELQRSEKDRAENVMIVDLMRNDLSRVCTDDSVRVNQLCGIESYAHVQHLVSVVEGRLRDEATLVDLLSVCFPGGSITGAPKIEAMRIIAKREPTARGPYCGSLGYLSLDGNANFNILIRTITAKNGWWQIPVGGGITLQSDPADEEKETWVKAEGMLRAIG